LKLVKIDHPWVWSSVVGKIVILCFLPIILYLGFHLFIIISPTSGSIFKDYAESQRIYDRHNLLLRESVNKEGNRAHWVSLDDISPLVIDATIAVEDKRFYAHSGVDFQALGRAFKQLILNGRIVSGASTISMQLSRMMFDYPRSWYGKLRQIFTAIRLDHSFDKHTILLQYLNRLAYGSGTMGIEAASQKYFRKPNTHLSLAEAAFLASLPKSPTTLNPFINFDGAKKRQVFVLEAMLSNGKITPFEYDQAAQEMIRVEGDSAQIRAMHFTDYVISQIDSSGDIVTTLDFDLQHKIDDLVKDHVLSNKAGGLTNAAVVLLDNKSGSILSMVGSTDYWNSQSGSVNGAISLRQPGSTLKPFTYALAFENKKTPATVVADIETRYLSEEGGMFIPRNYSENLYGPILMHDALGRSLNIPAIRTLNYVGIAPMLDRLHLIGFQSLVNDDDYYGLGLTLGNGEVTLLELAQSYAMFARGGLIPQTHFLMDSPSHQTRRAFSEDISFLITHILSDESLRIQAFGAANPLLFDFPIALKTGTSTNWRDNWVVGYTNKYTLAVWAGDFEGGVMDRLSGSIGAGPLFHKITQIIVNQGSSPEIPDQIEPTSGVEEIIVCPKSGLTPTENCPYSRSIYVLTEPDIRAPCDVHLIHRIDSRNGLLASQKCPSRYVEEQVFEVLPARFTRWEATHHTNKPPTNWSPLSPPDGITADAMVITSPFDGEVYIIEPGYDYHTQTIELTAEIDPVIPSAVWFVNGEKYKTSEWPYSTSWKLTRGSHQFRLQGGEMQSDPIEIEVR